MTVYNKLKIAILAIISSQTFAITIDPIQVQSGSGDLLYAEMKFRHSDPNARIEVGLAESNDLMMMGLSHQPPGNLNFFTRRSGDGSGVIVITSSRPVNDPELNILLKIKEGSATHIQQVKTSLKRNHTSQTQTVSNTEKVLVPQVIVSEKDIQLNLPSSTQYTNLSTSSTTPPVITTKPTSTTIIPSSNAPVAISIVPSDTKPLTSEVQTQAQPEKLPASITQITPKPQNSENTQAVATQITRSEPTPTQTKTETKQPKPTTPTEENTQKQQASKATAQPKNKKTADHTHKKELENVKTSSSKETKQHVVQANESLWKIASRIATQTNQSIPEVMNQIKANNEHAFIQGDINRIRRGAAINLAVNAQSTVKSPKNKTANKQVHSQVQSSTAKYRLNQAEMSLVADADSTTSHGKSKKGQQQNQTNAGLSTKVMTSREKTVKLQNNVSELALSLQEKDHKIQLLNARLAQLQQQLQQQNRSKKSAP